MTKAIKPGMMCLVKGAQHTLRLNGRIVQVVRASFKGDVFKTIEGPMLSSGNDEGWVCTSSSPLPIKVVGGHYLGETFNAIERPISGSCLIPISDPDMDVSEREERITQKEVDKIFEDNEHA